MKKLLFVFVLTALCLNLFAKEAKKEEFKPLAFTAKLDMKTLKLEDSSVDGMLNNFDFNTTFSFDTKNQMIFETNSAFAFAKNRRGAGTFFRSFGVYYNRLNLLDLPYFTMSGKIGAKYYTQSITRNAIGNGEINASVTLEKSIEALDLRLVVGYDKMLENDYSIISSVKTLSLKGKYNLPEQFNVASQFEFKSTKVKNEESLNILILEPSVGYTFENYEFKLYMESALLTSVGEKTFNEDFFEDAAFGLKITANF